MIQDENSILFCARSLLSYHGLCSNCVTHITLKKMYKSGHSPFLARKKKECYFIKNDVDLPL